MSYHWQKMADTRRQVASLVILILLSTLFFRLFYLPRQQGLRLEKSRLQGLRLERDSLKKVYSQTNVAPLVAKKPPPDDIKLKVLNEEIQPLSISSMPDFLKELTSPRFLRGLEVVSIHDKPALQEEGYDLATSVVALQGSFFTISSLVDRIEKIPLLVKIRDLSLKTTEKGGSDVVAELTLEFYQWRGHL
ncbi:MAG: type 4a pilus biogenesis protein PilO [Deltaproteobacteria bacterium]|nr:type 4a pilus biogenesis protein PilO [Deltaproteobacteria bacterium]